MKSALPLLRIAFSGGVLVQVCGVLIRLLLTAALARYIGADGLGAYTLCLAIAVIPQLPARVGLPAFLSYAVPKLEAENDHATARGAIRLAALAALLTFAGSGLLLGAVWLFTGLLGPPLTVTVLLLGLVVALAEALCIVLAAVIIAFGSAVGGLVYVNVVQPVLMVATIAVVAQNGSITLTEILAIHAVCAGLTTVMLAAKAGRDGRARWGPVKAAYPVKRLAHEAFPIVIAESVNEGATNVVNVLIGSVLTLRELGLFRIVQTLTGAVSFMFASLFLLVRPQVARLWHEHRLDELSIVLRNSARTAFGLSLAPFVGLALFAPAILRYGFGPGFVDAYEPLLIAALGSVATAAAGYGMPLLAMTQHSKVAMWMTGISSVFRVALVAALGFAWGLNGVALAVGFTVAAANIAVAIVALRLTGLDASIGGLSKLSAEETVRHE